MGNKQETSTAIEESTKPTRLNEELIFLAENFRQKHSPDIRVYGSFVTSGYLAWQLITYGYPGSQSDDEKYRGYIMIEPQDFPTTLAMLDEIAEQRLDIGKSTEFKWLMMTCPPNISNTNKFTREVSNIGEYSHLKPEVPRIVLYANDNSDIFDIYSSLISNPIWQGIEASRIDAFTSLNVLSPLRGSSAFTDTAGNEWRSLCFNNLPGTTEGHQMLEIN